MLRRRRRDIAAGAALVVVHQLAEVAVPVVIGLVIDRAVATGDLGSLVRWLATLAGLFVVLSAAGCIGLYVEERATRRAAHDVRMAVAERVLDARGGLGDRKPGEIMSLSTVETMRLGEGVGAVIIGAGAVAGTLAGGAVLLATSWRLGLVVVIGVPVALLVTQALSQPLVARADEQQAAAGSAAGVAADLVSGLRILKGLGAERAAAAAYRRVSGTALGAALDANRVRSTYSGIALGVAGGFLVVVALVGGRQALDGSITVGQLVAAVGVTQFLLGPLGRLALCVELLAQARASAAHVDEALAERGSGAGGTRRLRPTSVAGALRLRGVRHGTLDGLDLDVRAGEHVGVATTDPADAAALVACLDRSAEPEGALVLDGVPLAELDLDDARAAVVVAHHHAPLFGGTILDNVAAAAPEGADLDAAVSSAGAGALLDDRGVAELGEQGRTLSGGERQRVALARALATTAPVLVLHEPTTAVDAATEHLIARGVAAHRSGRTTVLVTTSPTLLAATDRVVLVQGGRLVAEGRHDELAAGEARYRAAVLT